MSFKERQKEIRKAVALLDDEAAELRGELEIIKAQKHVWQVKCQHPEAYTYSAMGELGRKCPDCGYAT